jgi:pilus assembly protein CpaC
LRLKSVLRFNPLLNLEFEKEKFILTGAIKELSEWKTLRALSLNNWLLKADISNTIISEVQKLLNKELAEKNTSLIEIYLAPFPSIRITKNFAKDNSRALDIIKMYGLNIILDDELMMSKPLIKVKLTLLEISKSSLMELGIKLPNQYSSQLGSLGKIENGSWTSEVNLQILENRGVGQILASPVLLTNSGAEAEFLAGGEIPIKVFNNKSKDVIWKKYGINLKIKPTVDSQGHIKMDIETEVSSLDPKRNVDGIPALLTNKIQSHFELQNSQTIILSGLIKNIRGETITGWPWLADIPILGALFSSSEFKQEKTELIILVTPEIKRND